MSLNSSTAKLWFNPAYIADDLRWILSGPSLINEFTDSKVHIIQNDWCNGLDNIDSKQIEKITQRLIENPRKRLGHYAETLVGCWLEELYDEVITNSPVQDGTRTVGEFDYLVRDGSKWKHCELAVKYYINIDNGAELSDWVGATLNDKFSNKMKKLERQMNLSQDVTAAKFLEEKGIEITGKELCLKGVLFERWDHWKISNDKAPMIAPDHRQGWWISVEQFFHEESLMEYDWQILEKPHWFAVRDDTQHVQFTHDELVMKCENGFVLSNRPQMVAATKNGKEISRGFIMPNVWPDIDINEHKR